MTFRDSFEASYRKMVRDAIRRGPFSKSECAVVLAVVNVWFHHKDGPLGYIHPSREKIAKRAGCTVKTVSRTFAKLRAARILIAKSSLRAGQGTSVRYRMNIAALLALCGVTWVDDFLRGYAHNRGENVPLNDPQMSRQKRDKMSHCLNDVRKRPKPVEFLPITQSLIDYGDVEF